MTGQELYERDVADRLARFDANPPKRMRKDGSLELVPRPKFTAWARLPLALRDGWEAKADAVS